MAKFTKLIKDGSGGGDTRDYRILAGHLSVTGLSKMKSLYYELYSETNGVLSEDEYGEHNIYSAPYNDSVDSGNLLWLKVPRGDKISLIANYKIDSTETVRITVNGKELNLNHTVHNDVSDFWSNDCYQTDYFEVPEDILDLEIYSYKEQSGGGSN